jgi:ubiquitin-conjugating enzyme E2 Q
VPRLPPPTWATNLATKQLGKEVKQLQDIQSRTALHELGWYMDFDSMENMFQWIVELHSFDAALPLAKDMKSLGVTSIVLEVRFGRNYP